MLARGDVEAPHHGVALRNGKVGVDGTASSEREVRACVNAGGGVEARADVAGEDESFSIAETSDGMSLRASNREFLHGMLG
jgi:hypothetical protein